MKSAQYKLLLLASAFAIGLASPVHAGRVNTQAQYPKESELSLHEAIELAIQHSPDMVGAEASYGAARGQRRQAGALMNPSIGFEAENVAGSGAYSGTDNAEFTLGINQQIQIGGKRSANIHAAEYGQEAARYGKSTAQLDLIRNVKVAFTDAVAAQEQSVIMQEQEKLARDVYATVNKRVTAAAEPVVQRNKAKISLANAELIAERAKGQKQSALKILAAQWNNAQIPSALASKDFYEAKKFDVSKDVETLLQNTPDYKQQSASIRQAKSLLDLEKANAIPDPTVSFGLRDLRATNDQALVLGLSIPLPVFNMNGGNIETARQQAVKAETDRQKTLLTGQANLAEHIQLLQNAYLTATRIKADILPEAQEAFSQAKRGYNAGKFAYLEVLDAQRTLTDTRITYIQALRDYHVNKAEVERLIAQDETISNEAKR
jgi:cobalt-zinc-cadmium efflux system outer membrane protein